MLNKLLRLTLLTGVLLVGIVRGEEIDDLVPFIIQIESSGNPHAVSPAGCVGLMQISKIVIKEFNLETNSNIVWWNLYDPAFNVAVGTWYLRRIKDHYLPHYDLPPTIRNILIAYNWGIGNLVKWHKRGGKSWELPKETQNYLKKVLKLYNKRLD